MIKVDTVIQLPVLENGGRHNGSGMVFGKDGFLYVARGQAELGGGANPTGATDREKRVWARGSRNPWTLAYDPYSGRILAGDVGEVPYSLARPSNWPDEYKNKIYIADYCGTAIKMVPQYNPGTAVDINNVAVSGMTVFYDGSKKKDGL